MYTICVCSHLSNWEWNQINSGMYFTWYGSWVPMIFILVNFCYDGKLEVNMGMILSNGVPPQEWCPKGIFFKTNWRKNLKSLYVEIRVLLGFLRETKLRYHNVAINLMSI